MLEQQGKYNDLSDKLRAEIEERVAGFGKSVRFKFKIDQPNPDPFKYNGPIIFPFIYTLDPKVFQITDPYEDRPGKQKVKTIALIDKLSEGEKTESRFKSIKISEKSRGVLYYDLESIEQQEFAAYCLLHPKLEGGRFMDKGRLPIFSIVDERKLATEQREERGERKKAMDFAERMSDKEVVDFADAMNWDSTKDAGILRNEIEDLAEHTPKIFNDLVSNEKMEYQAVVKQAFDNNVISYDPIGNQVTYVSTSQVISVLSSDMNKSEVERAAEWFQFGGNNAQKAYNKVKSLLKK